MATTKRSKGGRATASRAKTTARPRAAKKATFLFTNRTSMEGLPLAKMHPRVLKSRDGLNLVSYLTLPTDIDDGKGQAKKPVPLVLFVHGGPWARDTSRTPQLPTKAIDPPSIRAPRCN